MAFVEDLSGFSHLIGPYLTVFVPPTREAAYRRLEVRDR